MGFTLTVRSWACSSGPWGFLGPSSPGSGKTQQNTCVLAEGQPGLNRGFVFGGFSTHPALDFMSCLQTQGQEPGVNHGIGDL